MGKNARSVHSAVSNRRFSLTSVLLSRIAQHRTWHARFDIEGTAECIRLKCNAPAICLLTHQRGTSSQVTRSNEETTTTTTVVCQTAKCLLVCFVAPKCRGATNKLIYPSHLVGHIDTFEFRMIDFFFRKHFSLRLFISFAQYILPFTLVIFKQSPFLQVILSQIL